MNTPLWTPWALTIENYLEGAKVKDIAYPPPSADELRKAALTRGYPFSTVMPRHPDYQLNYGRSRNFKITHIPTGEVIGMDYVDVAHILPGHRGKGLMAQAYVIMDAVNHKPQERNLSPMSFGALCHAHALHVEDALKRKDDVPLNVVTQYTRRDGGGLVLKRPYTAEACNAAHALWTAAHIAAQRAEDITGMSP